MSFVGDFFGSSQSSQPHVTTVNQSPPQFPSELQPNVQLIQDEARRLYGDDSVQPQFGDFDRVARFSPQTEAALQGFEQMGQGSPLDAPAQAQALSTIQGDYVNAGNPHLGRVAESVANQVAPQVASRFALAGRGGSGAESSEFTRIMGDALAPYAFNNYEAERRNQLDAAGQMPGVFQNLGLRNLGALQTAGLTRDQQAQNIINAETIPQFDFNQLEPFRRLGTLQNMVGQGTVGPGMTTTTQPVFENNIASGLGALSTIASLGGPTGFGIWGS